MALLAQIVSTHRNAPGPQAGDAKDPRARQYASVHPEVHSIPPASDASARDVRLMAKSSQAPSPRPAWAGYSGADSCAHASVRMQRMQVPQVHT